MAVAITAACGIACNQLCTGALMHSYIPYWLVGRGICFISAYPKHIYFLAGSDMFPRCRLSTLAHPFVWHIYNTKCEFENFSYSADEGLHGRKVLNKPAVATLPRTKASTRMRPSVFKHVAMSLYDISLNHYYARKLFPLWRVTWWQKMADFQGYTAGSSWFSFLCT